MAIARYPTLQTVAAACGFASIVLALLADPIMSPALSTSYHWSGSASSLFGPVVLFFLLLWAALSVLLLSARQPGRWRIAIWSGLLLPAPWMIFRIVVLHWGTRLPSWVRVPRITVAAVLWLIIVLFWRSTQTARSERIIRGATSLLTYLGLSGAVLFGLVLRSWWQARNLNEPFPVPPQNASTVSGVRRTRVIWIILDELSYDQIFEHRFPGLHLPAFDAFAAQASVFTQVVPAGTQTDRVVPALMTGVPVAKVASSPDGGLLYADPATGKWITFPQHATVFQDALNDGFRTGIAGWYNPYCRIMPNVLSRCMWSDNTWLIDGIAPDGTLYSNLLGIFDSLLGNATLSKLFGSSDPLQTRQVSGQITDYENLVAAGDRLLGDQAAAFILLHMPFPHPPGYFNRVTGQLTTQQRSYIDNLALADRYVAHVRAVLEKSGEWDSSTVLLMGDHSWRTALIWRNAGHWTQEEEQASAGGHFDDRPAYLLKLSGERTGQRIESSFNALRTRQLLDAIFVQQIQTPDDLRWWVMQPR